MEGFIKLSRRLLDWDWHSRPKTAWLYVVLLLMANYEETNWRGQTIARGQVLTGRKQLATASGLTEDEVRVALAHLKESGDVLTKQYNRYSVITLTRYEELGAAGEAAQHFPQHSPHHNPQLDLAGYRPESRVFSDFRPKLKRGFPGKSPANAPANPHIQEIKEIRIKKTPAGASPDGAPLSREGGDPYAYYERF